MATDNRLHAPRFAPGTRCKDFVTGIPVVVEPLSERHPKTGQRLYLCTSPAGRVRRLQERNLRYA